MDEAADSLRVVGERAWSSGSLPSLVYDRAIEAIAGDIVALAVRGLLGGVLVVMFSLLSEALRPKSFAGLFGAAPSEVRGKNVLVVDETCGSGETLRLAIASLLAAGAEDVRSAVSFKTGEYEPDYFGLETESIIVLPWDKEIIVDGELLPNPKYD